MKYGLLPYWEISNGSCTTRIRDVCRLVNELGEPQRNCLIYVPRVKSKTRNINDDNALPPPSVQFNGKALEDSKPDARVSFTVIRLLSGDNVET